MERSIVAVNKNIEKEYKMLLTKQQYEKLFELLGAGQPICQTNHYFDTVDHQVRRKAGAMRIREINSAYIFTLKARKNSDTAAEYEMPVSSCNIEELSRPEIKKLLGEIGVEGPLLQVGQLMTWRSVIKTENAEICLDKNIYRDRIDYEIEYEYKKEHDGLRIFQEILAKVSLHYERNCLSKIARALGY